MGDAVNGSVLSLEDLKIHAEQIAELYRRYVSGRFASIQPVQSNEPKILNAGIEAETTLTYGDFRPAPEYQALEQMLGRFISPELETFQAEVMTDPADLFRIDTHLEDLETSTQTLFSRLGRAVDEIGLNALLIGGHPSLNLQLLKEFLTPKARYDTLVNYLDRFAQEAEIPFIDGSVDTVQGFNWEGFGTVLQTTIKVPHNFATDYHDVAYLLGPLLVATNASSPFVDGRATLYDSARVNIIPRVVYGFSEADRKAGRPGRWDASEPLNEKRQLSPWADQKMYAQLMEFGWIQEGVARYFAELAGSDSHLLVAYEDFERTDGTFPQPTKWPWTKYHSNGIMSDEGIGLELRIGEMPSFTELPNFLLTQLAMVQGLVEEMQEGKVNHMAARYFTSNMRTCSLNEPNESKQVYWPNGESGPAKKALPEVFEYLGKLAVEVLKRNGHNPREIPEIVNPVLTKVGVMYTGENTFKRIRAEPNPAQLMRRIAYQHQPDVKEGKPLLPETLCAVLEPFKCKQYT